MEGQATPAPFAGRPRIRKSWLKPSGALSPPPTKNVLAAADAAQQTGQIGALLRRESLYSSLLATWRKERAAGITQAMSPHQRGPKSKQSPFATENAKLQRENLRLTDRLRKAEIIIDVQKKLATLLGLPLRTPTDEELL